MDSLLHGAMNLTGSIMPSVTRSLHPLPFEHLEPKRFEDLVRQLVYDFRRWRQLEATGTAGSDDGFDARGYEIVSSDADASTVDEDEEAIEVRSTPDDRTWLIQCKREKRVGPSKLIAYLDEIPEASIAEIHGMIFVASCTFSKKARDEFRSWCASHNIQEFVLWGVSEVEDLLYQPKNDHLLFAYFGISLQIRRQKEATSIRRVVSLKRKIQKHIPDNNFLGRPIVVRDVSDERYPYVDGERLDEGNHLWLPCYSKGLSTFGLKIVLRHHWAYYNYENNVWDFASRKNLAIPPKHENPWHDFQTDDDYENFVDEARKVWLALPRGNQFHFIMISHIKYDDIIEIDDIGDDRLKVPTVFVKFQSGKAPTGKRARTYLHSSVGHSNIDVPTDGHVRLFRDDLRDVDWEEGWFARNSLHYSKETYVPPISTPLDIPPD